MSGEVRASNGDAVVVVDFPPLDCLFFFLLRFVKVYLPEEKSLFPMLDIALTCSSTFFPMALDLQFGMTPLMLACRLGSKSMVEMLIDDYRAEVNIEDKVWWPRGSSIGNKRRKSFSSPQAKEEVR